ncbi:interleukin-31 [Carlito syrichta]|uniref:Interleukin-31 n=1 Tax=Carlito syrichta TaxID=1868482 RepID=A0A1U7TD17_CARSF|nr:interleukin-31 [Carlito syrichta]
MVSHAGPATSVLFLLCCLRSWLSSHTFPIHSLPAREVQKIVEELRFVSEMLLENYVKEEKVVPTFQNYTLPCFTPNAQPPDNSSSSDIRAYFKAIRQFRDDTAAIDEVLEHLDKLRLQDAPETDISLPTDTFELKCFILTVFQQFSECVDHVLKSLTAEVQ